MFQKGDATKMTKGEITKIAVGYLRVSTQEQDEKFGKDAQKGAISQYAKEHGYKIVAWYEDVVSGVSDERPELNKVLYGDDIINPPFSAVIVFKSDRLARDTKLYFYYLYLLEKKGVKLLSVEEEFGGDQAFSNIYRSMMLFVAEQERKNIALRTSYGRKVKASCGGYSGGRPPYGYQSVDGKLVIKPDEAQVVKNIFAMYDDNTSQLAIAYYLNEENIPTKGGKKWTQPHIYYIINNRKFYEGYMKYGKDATWIKGVHEPLL